jgi:hypothetical protein
MAQAQRQLASIDVSDPGLYQNDSWRPLFAQLRREDPVHYCELGPAFGRRPGLNETVRTRASAIFWDAVGREVGFSLVRESPVASWTWVAWMTHIGANGQCLSWSTLPRLLF